jgi:hypothetical protein
MKQALRQLRRIERRSIAPPGYKPPSATVPGKPLNAQNVQQQIQALHGNPANALAFSSFMPGEGQIDPRDDQYWLNVSNLLFNTQQTMSQGQLAQTRSDLAYNKNLQDMGVANQREDRSLAEDAMRSGLGHSGWLNRSATEQAYEQGRDYEDLATGYTDDKADRAAAMSAAIQAYISGERGEALGAVGRFNEAQQKAATGPPLLNPKMIKRLSKVIARIGGSGGKGKGKHKGHGNK